MAKQAKGSTVVSFVATAARFQKLLEFHGLVVMTIVNCLASKKSNRKSYNGFWYLDTEDAVLPNALIVAFTDGANFEPNGYGSRGELTIDIRDQQVGLIVDGQQRYSALNLLEGKEFEVFVSAIICANEDELQKQFILINNTKPLPKELIYELLPTVDGLPPRLTARSFASSLTQDLNFLKGGVFEGLIKIHTNPDGVFTATALHKVIMNSKSNGALRDIYHKHDQGCVGLVNDFYGAVQHVFADDWYKSDNGRF